MHTLFDEPEERLQVMNNYMLKERELFDGGIVDTDRMGEISTIWKRIQNPR